MVEITQVLIIDCDSSGNGGTDITSYMTDYSVLYPKLWAQGTTRNMEGELKATFIGIFTKLQVTIRPINLDDFATLITSLNKSEVYCKYFDFETKQMQVEKFYFGDLETSVSNVTIDKFNLNQFSIIAFSKRTIHGGSNNA